MIQRQHEIERQVASEEAERRAHAGDEDAILEQREVDQRHAATPLHARCRRTKPTSTSDAGCHRRARATTASRVRGRTSAARSGRAVRRTARRRPRRSSRVPTLRGITGISHAAANAMPTPIGTLTQKMLRQPRPARSSVTSQPPSMKPTAAPRPIATPKMAKARARAASGNSVWMRGEHLRHHHRRGTSLAARAKISIAARSRQPAPQRGQREAEDAGDEHALAADDVAEPAAGDHQRGVGDLIDRDDRLDLGGIGMQVGADRRDRDVDDERIDHGEELRRGDGGQCPPAAGGRGRGSIGYPCGNLIACGSHRDVAAERQSITRGVMSECLSLRGAKRRGDLHHSAKRDGYCFAPLAMTGNSLTAGCTSPSSPGRRAALHPRHDSWRSPGREAWRTPPTTATVACRDP